MLFINSPQPPEKSTPGPGSLLALYSSKRDSRCDKRNADKRPRPGFVKAYMHNGYLKSLEEVVHFYNTRDALPRCQAGDPGEKVSCWPAPEYPETMNRRQVGNLGLTSQQEDRIVAFMKTLTDGYMPAAK